MNRALRVPILAVVIAIAVNAAMDAVGLSDISFASLFPLALLFWAVVRIPTEVMGFALGRLQHYGLALAHPAVIVGALSLTCASTGVLDFSQTDWLKARQELVSTVALSLVLGLLTEELFFRGWLFGAMQRAGLSERSVIVWTGIAFSLWHIPAVSMDTQDALPLAQLPVLLLNGVVIGGIWGLLRSVSGSILVTSLCHAVWNACVYVFFGFGTTVGALGVTQTTLYGPESGFLGLGLNLSLAALIWRWWSRRTIA